MKIRIFFSLTVLFFQSVVFAQVDSVSSRPGISYFNQLVSGGLLGKKGNGSALSIYTTHGIRVSRIAVGFGLGYDSYLDWRTLPFLGSVSYHLKNSKTASKKGLFLQLNYGFAKAWNPSTDADSFNYESSGGRLINPMIGYRANSGKLNIYFLAGYKMQRIRYTETPRWWMWGPSSNTVSVERNIERFSVLLGIGLN